MIRTVLLVSALVAAGAAGAQTPASPLPCAGAFANYRINDVRPGMMPLFEQAVRDHNAYYVSHHIPTHVVEARIIDLGPPASYSGGTVMTITTYTDVRAQQQAPHDADYDKFVGEYRQSSTMRSETRTCTLPAG